MLELKHQSSAETLPVNSEYPRVEEATLGGMDFRIVFPPKIITNTQLEQLGIITPGGHKFDSEYIRKTIGAETRRVAEDVSIQSFAEAAAIPLVSKDIEEVIFMTSYPSREGRELNTGHARSLAEHLQLDGITRSDTKNPTKDRHFACSTFARVISEASSAKRVMIVGAEKYSEHLGTNDTARAIFTDEAGAVSFRPGEDLTLLYSKEYYYPKSLNSLIEMPIDYSAFSSDAEGLRSIPVPLNPDGTIGTFVMNGKEVYKQMMGVAEQIKTAVSDLTDGGIEKNKIAHIIPHQASLKVLNTIRNGLGEDLKDLQEKFYINMKRGNSSSISVMRGLTELINDQRVKVGDVLIFAGFGAGLYSHISAVRIEDQ